MKEALKLALEALKEGDWYIGQLETIVYSADDDGIHGNRAKVQEAIKACEEALKQEQGEADELLRYLGLDPQTYRTDGGVINRMKVKAALAHPNEYPRMDLMDAMVSRFLTWPVPASVYPDGTPGQLGRTGTNLLNADEARQMLEHVLSIKQEHGGKKRPVESDYLSYTAYTRALEAYCDEQEKADAVDGKTFDRFVALNESNAARILELEAQLAEQEQEKENT